MSLLNYKHPEVSIFLRRQVAAWLTRHVSCLSVGDGPAIGAAMTSLASKQLTQTLGHLAAGLPIYDIYFRADRSFVVSES